MEEVNQKLKEDYTDLGCVQQTDKHLELSQPDQRDPDIGVRNNGDTSTYVWLGMLDDEEGR